MGRGYYFSLVFIVLHLLILLLIQRSMSGFSYILSLVIFLLYFGSAAFIIQAKTKLKYLYLSLYFGSGLLYLIYIYFNSKTYYILLFAIVEVFGYIYSLEKINVFDIHIQKKLYGFINSNTKNTNEDSINYVIDKNMPIPVVSTGLIEKNEKILQAVEVYHQDDQKIKEPALFIGSKTSGKFHLPGCRYVKNIAKKNKITFSSLKEAKDKGFKTCVCVKR